MHKPGTDTRHTSRFLMLWLATLPYVLWNHVGWGVVPSTAVISFLLFGIDEIAIQLEVRLAGWLVDLAGC
jgi:putative membrane protein